jgi:DNA polymerase-1
LAGDASDNIPGVTGIGPKTACQLLNAFGSLNGIYEALKEPAKLTPEQKLILKEKTVEKLVNDYEYAMLSQKLATIDNNVPLDFKIEDCAVSGYEKKKVVELFLKLGFKSLVQALPEDEFEQGVQDAVLNMSTPLQTLLSRTPLKTEFSVFLQYIESEYPQLGKILTYSPILEGYESANILLSTAVSKVCIENV